MFKAGIDQSVPAFTVNIRCGSGLRTIMLAADRIRLGDAHTILAGGMESATNTPFILRDARCGHEDGREKGRMFFMQMDLSALGRATPWVRSQRM